MLKYTSIGIRKKPECQSIEFESTTAYLLYQFCHRVQYPEVRAGSRRK